MLPQQHCYILLFHVTQFLAVQRNQLQTHTRHVADHAIMQIKTPINEAKSKIFCIQFAVRLVYYIYIHQVIVQTGTSLSSCPGICLPSKIHE